MRQFLIERQPDLLLITPLIDIGSPQLDHFAAARALGIRTRAAGRQLGPPVQQGTPARPARARAGLEPDAAPGGGGTARRAVRPRGGHRRTVLRPVVRPPAVTQPGGFCARVGLDPERAFVLYTCSSLFRGTVSEPEFVESWVRALRTSKDPRLRGIGILIRPHPARLDEWRAVDLSGQKNLVFWGTHPVDAEAKNDYFDSMYYSAGVVGINTSAFLEAAVVGKPVHTVLLPDVSRDNQEGTLHFRYLLNVNGGLLRAARSLEEHWALLAGSLAPGGWGRRKGKPLRGRVLCGPMGRGEAATPRFVSAIGGSRHAAGAAARAPLPSARGSGFLAMYPVASVLAVHLRSQPWRKRTRHKLVKQLQKQRTLALRRIKQFAIDHPGAAGKQRKSATGVGGSALTPKTGRQRDPAKTLAGTDVREARHARELVTAGAERSSDHRRPVAVGDRLRAAVLDPVRRLGQGLRQLRARRAWWWCRAGARRRGIATSPPTRGQYYYKPRRIPGQERGPHRGAGGAPEASGNLVLDRCNHRPRRGQARGLNFRGAAPLAHVSAVRAFWCQRRRSRWSRPSPRSSR